MHRSLPVAVAHLVLVRPFTLVDIRAHPFAWRWTDAKHAVFPDGILAQMQPVSADEAARLFAESRQHEHADGLRQDQFTITTLATAGVSTDAACEWLCRCQPDLSARIVICWDERTALRTTWEVFTAHWDDFCYPASDDVLIWPESAKWVMRYHHEEELQFGRRGPTA